MLRLYLDTDTVLKKTVATHKILINAKKTLCLSSRNMIDKTMCEVL
jgi:hypothetical protein